MSPSTVPQSVFWLFTYLLRIALGVALVWLRPGWMTGMFYIGTIAGGSIGTGGSMVSDMYAWLPPLISLPMMIPHDLVMFAAPFAFALFALLFPNDRLTGWGRRALPFVLGGLAGPASCLASSGISREFLSSSVRICSRGLKTP